MTTFLKWTIRILRVDCYPPSSKHLSHIPPVHFHGTIFIDMPLPPVRRRDDGFKSPSATRVSHERQANVLASTRLVVNQPKSLDTGSKRLLADNGQSRADTPM